MSQLHRNCAGLAISLKSVMDVSVSNFFRVNMRKGSAESAGRNRDTRTLQNEI